MNPELLLNIVWAVTIWMGASTAAVLLLGRCPAVIRRNVCRAGLIGVPIILAGAIVIHHRAPSSGLILRSRISNIRRTSPDGPKDVSRGHKPPVGTPLITQPRKGERASFAKDPAAPSGPTQTDIIYTETNKPTSEAKTPISAPPSAHRSDLSDLSPVDWRSVVAAGVALFSGVFIFVAVLQLFRLATWRRTWMTAPPAWVSLTQRLAKRVGLNRPFSVFIAPGLSQPVAAGVIRPAIVLPALSDKAIGPALRGALSHELGHLVSRDPLWNLIGQIVTAIAWWCPLAWWLRRRARIESELTADDCATESGVRPTDLAKILARFAETNHEPIPAAISPMACHLRRRIEMMMNDKDSHNPRSTFSARWATILSGFVIALAVVATPLVGTARAEEDVRTDDRPAVRTDSDVKTDACADDPPAVRTDSDVKTDDRREPERDRERARRTKDRGREVERQRRDGERRRADDERPKRIICTAGVEDGWIVAEGRTRDRRRRLIWRLRLGKAPKGKDPKPGIRYDGPFVVITSGKQRFIINAETGQLRRSDRPEAKPRREDHAIGKRLKQAESKVADLEENLEKAEKNLKRLIRLHKEGRADERAVEKAEKRFKEIRERLHDAQAELKKLRAAAKSRRDRRTRERAEGRGDMRERGERGREKDREGRDRGERKGDVEELREQIRHLQRQLEQAKRKLKRFERGRGEREEGRDREED